MRNSAALLVALVLAACGPEAPSAAAPEPVAPAAPVPAALPEVRYYEINPT